MFVQISELRLVQVSKAASQRISKAEREGLCVACLEPLGHDVVRRGCHEKCYRATLRAVEKGLTTIEQRVREGKLLATARGASKSNPVTLELSDA